MQLSLNILRNRSGITVIFLFGLISTGMAQDGTATNIVPESAGLLRSTGIDALSSIRDAVEFQACLGVRKSVELNNRDELWLLDARQSHLSPCDLSLINVKKLECGRWNRSSLNELASEHFTDPSKETVVFIHGNQTNERWSVTRGAQLYKNLFKSCCNRKPIRLVIWQWKSERDTGGKGCIKDYYNKSARSVRLGTTLALTLGKLHDRNVTLIGYSLGAQTALSAMRQPDPTHSVKGCGYRIALIAPALDCNFISQSATSPTFGNLIESVDVFYNSSDRALKLHERICKKKNGSCYISLEKFIQMQIMYFGQVRQQDVGGEVGKMHCLVRYAKSPTIRSGINRLISSNRWLFESELGSLPTPESERVDRANGFFITDPILNLDLSSPVTRAYLLEHKGL